jgi:hypothetical protein
VTVSGSAAVSPQNPDTATTFGASAHLMSTRSGEAAAHSAGSTRGSASTSGTVCTDSCAAGSLMVGIMCAVILAALLLVLLPRPRFQRVASDLLRRVEAHVVAHVAPLRPPSLLVLSISRT